MYTKEDLKEYLKAMGLTGKETILVHSSMKSIGEVEGRADTVLDALIEYFKDGLLLLPTHTWKNINEDNPVYDPAVTPSCVGILTNLFLKRDGVIRSLHPTHSMAGIGVSAKEYLAGEEYNNTPCTPGGCYDRLKDCGGKILLIGVGNERNTYIHSVEEVLNIPNRLSDKPMKLQIIMPDKSIKTARNGIVSAQIAAQNEQVKTALENQMVTLREQFESQGLKVDAVEITVMAHSFEAGQNFGQSESERKQGESKVHRKLDLSSFDDELEEDLESTAPAPKAEGSSVEYLA